MANQDIRELMKENRVYIWEVAQAYGCAESTFIKKLRVELPQEDKDKIIAIINELKQN